MSAIDLYYIKVRTLYQQKDKTKAQQVGSSIRSIECSMQKAKFIDIGKSPLDHLITSRDSEGGTINSHCRLAGFILMVQFHRWRANK